MLRRGKHAGKGAAVRAGVARATGHQIVFMDADMATDLDFLNPLLASLDEVDMAIGSRSAPGAVTSGVTPSSDAAHRAFNQLARKVTGMSIMDFQCGFKAFRGPVAKLLFHFLREPGYAFDVELLATADRLGYDLREVPVRWEAVRGSHVRIVVDSLIMAVQVTRISRQSRSGRPMSTLEAFGRDPGIDADALAALVREHLPIDAPVFAWDQGALALLPFVQPVDVAELADELEQHLDVVARPSMLDGGALFEPGSGRMRAALTAS